MKPILDDCKGIIHRTVFGAPWENYYADFFVSRYLK